jgi:hypothetical protein
MKAKKKKLLFSEIVSSDMKFFDPLVLGSLCISLGKKGVFGAMPCYCNVT